MGLKLIFIDPEKSLEKKLENLVRAEELHKKWEEKKEGSLRDKIGTLGDIITGVTIHDRPLP